MKSTMLVVMAMLTWAGSGVAAEHPEHPEHPAAKAAKTAVIEATVTGQNLCLACALKAEQGAAAQCVKYGHENVLRVSSATAAGKDLPELKGWTLSYLKNDGSQPYLTAHTGETLTVTGKVYPESRVLEVVKVQAAAKAEHPKKAEHPQGSEHPGGSK